VIDIRTGRIPNWLVFGGALYALAYNSLFPFYPKDNGTLLALQGLAVGLGAFLPFYVFRAMGAGDVKLMAMVGAFLGLWPAVHAVLATLVAGGVLAVVLAVRSGRLSRVLENVAMMCRGTMLTVATGVGGLAVIESPAAGTMPYGAAIAAGSIGYLLLAQLGFLGGM
jgi:prepilin peptidase CpaA